MGEKKEKKSKKKDKEEAPADSAASAAEESASEAPKEEAPKKAARGTSNVFALFNQSQIQEFKEAFTMIDQDRDGVVGEGDLISIWQQVGRDIDNKEAKNMISEAPSQLNFTGFLTLFGEKLHGTDPENTLREAFKMFDPDKKGVLPEPYVKQLLMETGDLFNKDEIKQTWKEAPIEGGMLDYNKLVTLIKRGPQDEDQPQ